MAEWCKKHQKKKVCPSCIARMRGKKGGQNRVKNAKANALIDAAGRMGGRKAKDSTSLVPPATVMTPLNDQT